MRSILSEIRPRLLKMLHKEEKPTVQNEAIVSLTFDDAYESVYFNAYPSMKEREFRGIIFVIAGLIGDYFEGHKIMNEKQLHELSSNGWEIGSHTFSHPWSLTFGKYTPKQYEAEIALSKSLLEKLGFDVISFAYPHGFYSGPMVEEVKKGYKYGKTANHGINEMCQSNLLLKSIEFANDRLDDVKLWIDKLKSKGGWLIITCHGIVADLEPLPEPIYGWSHRAAFDSMLNYIEEKEIRVAKFREINKSMQRMTEEP